MVALSNNQILLSLSLSSSQSATPPEFNHLAGFSYIRRRPWKLRSAPQQYQSSSSGNSKRSLLYNPKLEFKRKQLINTFSVLNLSIHCNGPCISDGNLSIQSGRIKRSQLVSAKNYEAGQSEDAEEIVHKVSDDLTGSLKDKTVRTGSSFLAKLVIALGIAATITFLSIGLKQPNQGSNFGIQYLVDGSSSSTISTPAPGFSFKAFGYRVMLPEYAPGWIYFWLLMAAGFGLFISEEALNIWVGISLARMLVLDGTWQSLVSSFYRNAPYITSIILWVYWGVCISDMIPFYLGKLFKQSGASDDVCSKLGIGNQKARDITNAVQKYGNLIGFVERFSLGVRNPTAFLAGALDISPECFFAGVCCGGLITFPIQLTIGFLLRERPVFAVATVATVVGIWTVFPYAVATSTALFLYLRRQFSG